MTKATDTHSEYVILIAVPPHQWLHERASLLRHMLIDCLVLLRLRIKPWAEHAEREDRNLPFNVTTTPSSCYYLLAVGTRSEPCHMAL